MFCSELFADKYNFIYNFCPKNGPACEDSQNEFVIKNYTDTAIGTFNAGSVGQSCTFHVKTKCGFPRLMVNVTDNPEHFDVVFGLGQWNESSFNLTLFKEVYFHPDN